ncbi:MAG: mechanosensitive ion channel family protein [Chloroflexi bacterium]|nr:MAG: mechanosensitive ion channel family protein [Chloroflexota bacterium]
MNIFSWDWFLGQGIWVLVTLAIAALAYWALRRWTFRGVNSLVRRITPEGENWERASHVIARGILWLGTLAIVAAVVLGVLPRVGVDISAVTQGLRNLAASIGAWLGSHGIRIAVLFLLGLAAHYGLKRLIPAAVERAISARGRWREESEVELKKRLETLKHFLTGLALVVIWVIVGFMILSEIGVDIGPLLAGAGVVGIAIGFGAQSLIRDVLSGFFIIMENHYGKGDVIRVGDIAGGVEELNIRRTILRDLDGARHVIPNGEIRIVSNLTQEWSRAHLNISVAYKEDLDRVMAIMRKTWEEMAQDPKWGPFMISKTPWLLRVDEFGDSGINIKMVGETQPIKQWDVMGEYRRRIKRIFDEEGIEIPWPHVKLYLGDDLAKGLTKYGQALSGAGPRMGKKRALLPGNRRAPRKRFHPHREG